MYITTYIILVNLPSEDKINSFSFIQDDSENISEKFSYRILLQNMQNTTTKTTKKEAVIPMNNDDNRESFYRNIFIWLPITLFFVLYFIIYEMVNMSVHKSSILYAKYGTNKAEKMGGR